LQRSFLNDGNRGRLDTIIDDDGCIGGAPLIAFGVYESEAFKRWSLTLHSLAGGGLGEFPPDEDKFSLVVEWPMVK
jgi:hypothetical protein